VSYTLGKGRGNTDVGNNEIILTQVGGDLNLAAMDGPTSVDQRHIFSANATWIVPRTGGLVVSGVVQARSGVPMTLVDSSADLNRNGRFDDEFLPAGTFAGNSTDPNAITVENAGGRRGAYGPGYFGVDMRVMYRVQMAAQRALELFVDVFNVTNRANFDNPTTDRRNANFLILREIVGAPRTAQLNVRFTF
jgi:hypothetical protein